MVRLSILEPLMFFLPSLQVGLNTFFSGKHAESFGSSRDPRGLAYWVCTFSNSQWHVKAELGDGNWKEPSCEFERNGPNRYLWIISVAGIHYDTLPFRSAQDVQWPVKIGQHLKGATSVARCLVGMLSLTPAVHPGCLRDILILFGPCSSMFFTFRDPIQSQCCCRSPLSTWLLKVPCAEEQPLGPGTFMLSPDGWIYKSNQA